MKWHYDPTTKEPITGILPASVTLPYKTTAPPKVKVNQYVLAGDDGGEDWLVVTKPDDLDERKVQIQKQRQVAYADPLTGSDRLFAEAYRMSVMGELGTDQVKADAIARFSEIQQELPWPVLS